MGQDWMMLGKTVRVVLWTCVAVVLSQTVENRDYLQPYNLTVSDFSTYNIALTWECDCGDETQYQLWYWPVNASMDLTMTVTSSKTYVVRNLEPGQLYSVWLLAAEGNLTSEYVTLQHRTSAHQDFQYRCLVLACMQTRVRPVAAIFLTTSKCH